MDSILIYIILVSIMLVVLPEFYVKNRLNKIFKKTNSKTEALDTLRKINKYAYSPYMLFIIFVTTFLVYSNVRQYTNVYITTWVVLTYFIIYYLLCSFLQLLIINRDFNRVRETDVKISSKIKQLLLILTGVFGSMGIMLNIIFAIIDFGSNFKILSIVLVFALVSAFPLIISLIRNMLFKFTYKAKMIDDDNKYKVLKDLKEMARSFGIKKIKFYIWDMNQVKHANAFAFGLFKYEIALTSYLLENLEEDEIKSIVCHECGHIVNKDMKRRIGFQMISTIILMFLLVGVIFTIETCYYEIETSNLMLIAISFAALYEIIVNIFSKNRNRVQEQKADAFVLENGFDKEVYINALSKIYNLNDTKAEQNKSDENMQTHPSLENRIKNIRKI